MIVRRLMLAINEKPIFFQNEVSKFERSAGLAYYPPMADNSRDLMDIADKSMYGMKAACKAECAERANAVRR